MEERVRFLAVEADAKDAGILGLKLRHQAAEPAALKGSARGRRLGIEPEHHKLPRVVPEAVCLAFVVAQREGWRWVSDVEHGVGLFWAA